MRNQRSGKKAVILIFSLMVFFFVFGNSPAGALKKTHTVQKGDTLWDICQAYYGDPNLWPKLWEMNPFVTNPHLLKPGYIFTLLEEVETGKETAGKPVEKTPPSVPSMKGVDVSGLTNPEAMGYLSLVKVESWGFIEAATTSNMGLSEGETAFVKFEKNADTIHDGQEFAIVTCSPLIRHPLTDRPLGHIVADRGKLIIKERIKEDHFRAQVTQVYSEIGVGSLIVPPTPSSECIYPMATDPKLYGNVVALKDNQQIIGQFSVVYLDSGFKDGIKRGSVFDLVRIISVPSPNLQHDSYDEIFAEMTNSLSREAYLAEFWEKLQAGEKIYEQPVGQILVVEARPDTSTAIVLTSSRDLSRGAFVKGTSWVELPDYLSILPSCPLQ
jgi:hypothetical protein